MADHRLISYPFAERLPNGGMMSQYSETSIATKFKYGTFQGFVIAYYGYRDIIIRRGDGTKQFISPDLRVADNETRDSQTELMIYATDLGTKVTQNSQPHKSIHYTGHDLLKGPIYFPEYGVVIYYPEFEHLVYSTPFGGVNYGYGDSGCTWPANSKNSLISAVYHTNNPDVKAFYLSINCGPTMKVEVKPAFNRTPYLFMAIKNSQDSTYCRGKIVFDSDVETVTDENDPSQMFICGVDLDKVKAAVKAERTKQKAIALEVSQLKSQLNELTRENSLLKTDLTNTKKELDNAVDPDRKSLEQATLAAKKDLLNGETALSLSKQRAAVDQISSELEIQRMRVEKEQMSTLSTSVTTTGSAIKAAVIAVPAVAAAATAVVKMTSSSAALAALSAAASACAVSAASITPVGWVAAGVIATTAILGGVVNKIASAASSMINKILDWF